MPVPLSNHDNPIAIDYDPVDARIYWTDVGTKRIRSATLAGTDEKTVRQLSSGLYHEVYLKCDISRNGREDRQATQFRFVPRSVF